MSLLLMALCQSIGQAFDNKYYVVAEICMKCVNEDKEQICPLLTPGIGRLMPGVITKAAPPLFAVSTVASASAAGDVGTTGLTSSASSIRK